MSPPHLIPLANGLAQSAVSLARFMGPILGGTIWAASIAHVSILLSFINAWYWNAFPLLGSRCQSLAIELCSWIRSYCRKFISFDLSIATTDTPPSKRYSALLVSCIRSVFIKHTSLCISYLRLFGHFSLFLFLFVEIKFCNINVSLLTWS